MKNYKCSGCGKRIRWESRPKCHMHRLKCGDCKKAKRIEYRMGHKLRNQQLNKVADNNHKPWDRIDESYVLKNQYKVTHAEMAEVLGRSIDSVSSKLHKLNNRRRAK